MAEEEGLNYTIRFIPDVTAIDQEVKKLADKVSKEISDAVGKARGAAGDVTGGAKGAPSVGIMDRLMEGFNSLKERVTAMLTEVSFLSGRALSLQHPTSATLASITATTATKLAAGDPAKLSKDQVLQLSAAVSVAVGRIKAAQEHYPDLSKEDAIQRVAEENLGEIKGVADRIFGVNVFKSLKGAADMIRHAAFAKRGLADVGVGPVKEVEQNLMEALGHDIIEEIGTSITEAKSKAQWEGKDITFTDLYKAFGYEGDPKTVPGAKQHVADLIRLVDGIFEITEFKPVGESRGADKFMTDVENLDKFLTELNKSEKMQAQFAERAGMKAPKEGVTAVGAFMAGADKGGVEAWLQDADISDLDFIAGIDFENIGDTVRNAMSKAFQNKLPALQNDMETDLIGITPSLAQSHMQELLAIMEILMGVLDPHSLPEFWKDIGVDRWIAQSAMEYVNTLTDGIATGMYRATKDEIFLGASPDTPEPASPEPRSDSERILGKLDTMDFKLDEIKSDLPRGSGTSDGSLLGTMKERSRE